MATIIPTNMVNSSNGRPLFKNIKNQIPTNVIAGKKSISTTTSVVPTTPNATTKKSVSATPKGKILFTPSSNSLSVAAKQTPAAVLPVPVPTFEQDTNATLQVEELAVPILSPAAPAADVCEPFIPNPNKITYSVDFMLSLRSKCTPMARPAELDLINEIIMAKSAMTSLLASPMPSTPKPNHNNFTNVAHSAYSTYGASYPLNSPAPSPFKVASSVPSSPFVNMAPIPFQLTNSRTPMPLPLPMPHLSAVHPMPLPLPMPMNSTPIVHRSAPASAQKLRMTPLSSAFDNSAVAAPTASASQSDKVIDGYLVLDMKLKQLEQQQQQQAKANKTSATSTKEASATKPIKEMDPVRLAARQRQIEIGKNTVEYELYSNAIPKSLRRKDDPKTPNKNQQCSKRSFDGQIRKWRRALHRFDPNSGEMVADDEEDEVDIDDDDMPAEPSPTPTKPKATKLNFDDKVRSSGSQDDQVVPMMDIHSIGECPSVYDNISIAMMKDI
ncbi:hypothetical protein SAMD00019534_075370 [Acytostelium subglobosum LB1]|uniref:hypothetical protein n=1 Tax=Acytostelium subglobosum LB1 TaxID=1410327 RepID=UPI0006451FD7|nr:hypothetical protein SAMD00019534_075370 [Acytostelium subglobosum LB1]GAM24362.1 hypothetical protein SAMD00019534_075370 [Acytostelium subglobosum LB1]|eukprot:XP_012752688.1 hypothetical protein SAMD00019534_075370 [Acytostelium subglobosum LB1]